ncbi:MAG: PorT family protein [Bacteroidales bacterium]|nr:PorT family protein [Bacteroidales bacterium]
MKAKGLFLWVLLILVVFTTNAQVKIGIKEGINLSTQSELGMLWDNNDVKTGFTLGVTMDYRFHSVISLQTELNYKTEGLAYENKESSNKMDVNRNYDYYNIPLLLKGRFNEQLGLGETWLVSFYGGPYYSYLRSAESEIKENGVTTVSDYDDISNDSDWGIIIGGEVAKVFNKGELFIDLRYEMGLSDVTENDDIKNKVIGLGVGYRF